MFYENSSDFIDQCPEISARTALKLLNEHGQSLVEFLRENEVIDLHSSASVLGWLGY